MQEKSVEISSPISKLTDQLSFKTINLKMDKVCIGIYDTKHHKDDQFDGLVQNCSDSISKAPELLQSCTKSSSW